MATLIRVSIENSGEEIDVPEIPPCDRTQEELEKLKQERRMMVCNPGIILLYSWKNISQNERL